MNLLRSKFFRLSQRRWHRESGQASGTSSVKCHAPDPASSHYQQSALQDAIRNDQLVQLHQQQFLQPPYLKRPVSSTSGQRPVPGQAVVGNGYQRHLYQPRP